MWAQAVPGEAEKREKMERPRFSSGQAGRYQPGVQVVKQAWARGCACLVLGCTDVKLYSKQDLSHPRALPFPLHHTAFLCVVRGPKLGQTLHPFLPS